VSATTRRRAGFEYAARYQRPTRQTPRQTLRGGQLLGSPERRGRNLAACQVARNFINAASFANRSLRQSFLDVRNACEVGASCGAPQFSARPRCGRHHAPRRRDARVPVRTGGVHRFLCHWRRHAMVDTAYDEDGSARPTGGHQVVSISCPLRAACTRWSLRSPPPTGLSPRRCVPRRR